MGEAERAAAEAGIAEDRVPTHAIVKLFKDTALLRVDATVAWLADTFLVKDGPRAKVLVFAHHRAVLDALEAALARPLAAARRSMVRVDGAVVGAARDARIRAFKADPDCAVALLSIRACGTGLSLTEAAVVVFAEMYWVWAEHAQAEDRVHRVSQDRRCAAYYAMFRDSLDAIIWRGLLRKAAAARAVVDGALPEPLEPPATTGAPPPAPPPPATPPKRPAPPRVVTRSPAKRPRRAPCDSDDDDSVLGYDPGIAPRRIDVAVDDDEAAVVAVDDDDEAEFDFDAAAPGQVTDLAAGDDVAGEMPGHLFL